MSRGLLLFQLNLQPVRCRQLQWSFRPIVVYPLPRRHKQSFAWKRILLPLFPWDLQWSRPVKLQRLPLRLILPFSMRKSCDLSRGLVLPRQERYSCEMRFGLFVLAKGTSTAIALPCRPLLSFQCAGCSLPSRHLLLGYRWVLRAFQSCSCMQPSLLFPAHSACCS